MMAYMCRRLLAIVGLTASLATVPARAADYENSQDAILDGQSSIGKVMRLTGEYGGLYDATSFKVKDPAVTGSWYVRFDAKFKPVLKQLRQFSSTVTVECRITQNGDTFSRSCLLLKFISPPGPKPSPEEMAQEAVDKVDAALWKYMRAVGSFPTTDQGLKALIRRPKGVGKWNGPYCKPEDLRDPWKTEFKYSSFSHPQAPPNFELRSAGPDSKFDTEDDVYHGMHGGD